MNTSELETLLRSAPQPAVPAGLKQRLYAQAPARGFRGSNPGGENQSLIGRVRRWWPVLAPATLSVACAAVFSLQRLEIHDLQKSLQGPPVSSEPAVSVKPGGEPTTGDNNAEEAEIARLKTVVGQLEADISNLGQLQLQNERMRQQLAPRFTPEETKAMEDARDRALSIQCVNNLKQLGLAVRMWSLDHGDISPPNVQCLSNYVASTTTLFVCPADTARQAAVDTGSFTPANCSYEYLAPSAPDTEPNRVLFRCPIHGNIGLIDGSVQMRLAKEHPESLIQQDGKLYVK